MSEGGTAIVVPGHAVRRLGDSHRISAVCLRLVDAAALLAESQPVDAVVFSGWSRGRGISEAEQMRDAWRGPDVELVVEPTASMTAENAARTLPLLVERGISRALVVCAPLHVYRARFFFSRLYGAHGIASEFHVVTFVPRPQALVWELAAAPLVRRQLRAAEAELARSVRS